MAITHIDINQAASGLASETRNFVTYLKKADKEGKTIKEIMETYIDGTDYTALGTALGVTAAEAETVYNLIAGAVTGLDAADLHQPIIRLG